MKYVLAVALAVPWMVCMPVHATDLSKFLGKPVGNIASEMVGVATCTNHPHSVRLPVITPNTQVRRDLFNPVSGNLIADGDSGLYNNTEMFITRCVVAKSGYINIYSNNNFVFRISITYNRCKADSAAGNCLETDEIPRPYDFELYDNLKHKDAYIDDSANSFYMKYRTIIANQPIKDYAFGLDRAPWESQFKFNRNRISKCIGEISVNRNVLQATTVYEIYDKGYIRDTLVGRFAAQRLFVDIAADQAAIDNLVEKMNNVVQEKRDEFFKSNEDEISKQNRVNKILGTPAPK